MKQLLLLVITWCLTLIAQAADRRLEEINSIKKSPLYLYAEATMKDSQEATATALDILRDEIIRWSAEEKLPMDSMLAQQICMNADTLMMPRADMTRVFVYVKKTSLAPSSQEQPKDSTLLNADVKQMLHQHFAQKKEKEKGQGRVMEKIMKARNFFELREIMEPLKESGEIVDYGKYLTAQNPTECYLIVYDPAGNILAWLDKGEDMRKNLKTGKNDTIKNYRGCGAIWFTINENK